MLITSMVPRTPVFGSAEESVDSAPTHHTLLDDEEAAANEEPAGATPIAE